MRKSIGDIVRKAEDDYLRGNTQISKYVPFSMYDTISTIEAYLNSKHVSGEFDSQGREKPFFNIVVAAANIWMRATDIDRADIKVRATAGGRVLDSFLATVFLREWMRESRFGTYLNDWGRTLARYGSAITKLIEDSEGLWISVTPWGRIICDAIDFDGNPKIEVLELTEGQLYERVETMHYDAAQVKALCDALTDRKTLDKRKKDNKADYIKLYELHGYLPKSNLTGEDADENKYVQQMHVISFVGVKGSISTP